MAIFYKAEKPIGNIIHVSKTPRELFAWIIENDIHGAVTSKMNRYETEDYLLESELGIKPEWV